MTSDRGNHEDAVRACLVTAPRQCPSDRGRVTLDQRIWITHRDRIGEVIDAYLATRPPPEMREAVEVIEGTLRVADHASGLT